MKLDLSTGTGLGLLAASISLHAVIGRSGVEQRAIASSPVGPAEPTVVGFAATSIGGESSIVRHFYHRLWSDGAVEILFGGVYDPIGGNCTVGLPMPCPAGWQSIPDATPGYACRPDIDGNRVVDGADLTMLLAAWGQAPSCDPLPDIACTVGQVR